MCLVLTTTTMVAAAGPAASAEIMRLDAGNFELAVQTYPTLAILFYDHRAGPEHARAVKAWEEVSWWL